MKNYFVNAYVRSRSRSSSFIDTHIRMMEIYVPYLKDGKLSYKEKSIEPKKSLKSHIFINDGQS